jgi:hypothetical protein
VTALLVRFLASGENVNDVVTKVDSIFFSEVPRDPLDTRYEPPLWWIGDGTVTMT